MNKIILGTVQFGLKYGINNDIGKPNFSQVKSILDYAFENNVNFLDTAEAYGNSHEIIGKYHSSSINKFKVITKYSPKRTDLPQKVSDRIFHNLSVLDIDDLYCYMFHSYKDFNEYYRLFKPELIELKRLGKIKKIGVSLHHNKNINKLIKLKEIDLIQIPFNLLDNNKKRKEILSQAKNIGLEIHARSIFLQGLFFKDLNIIEGKPLILKKYLTKIENLIEKNQINNLALNYVYYNQNIDGVLFGVDSLNQLKKNISCINSSKFFNIFNKIDSINVEEENLLDPSNW